jgi:hypothetical protein
MRNYKKNDPRMWWFYTKVGRIIIYILIAFVIGSVILKAFNIID